jgi:long-chain fatty acid transport protein
MKSRIFLLLVSLAVIFGMSSELLAGSWADTYGFSSEGLARGGSMGATVNDWSSVWYNPAGLGKTQNIGGTPKAKRGSGMSLKLRDDDGGDQQKEEIYPSQIAISCMYTFPMMNLNIFRMDQSTGIPLTTKADDIDPYGFIVIGAAVDLNVLFKIPEKYVSSIRLGAGIGLNSDATLAKVNDLDPRTHNFIRYGRDIQRAMIVIGLGLGFWKDFIGIGAAVNSSFSGKGAVTMEGNITGDPQLPPQQAKMDLGIDPGIIAGIYISPGKLVPVIEGLEIGASWREETKLEIFPFEAAAIILGGAISMNLNLSIFDYYTPHTITGGIAYTRWGVTLSADIDYQMWSRHKISKGHTYNYYPLPKLVDVMVYRGSVMYQPLPWMVIMAGYFWQPTVLAPNAGKNVSWSRSAGTISIGRFNYLDANRHNASFGLKFIIPKLAKWMGGQVVIVAAYQFQYLEPVNLMKVPQAGEDYMLNPAYSYDGMNHTIMAEVGMRI